MACEEGVASTTVRAWVSRALSDQRIRFLIVGGFNTAFGPAAFVTLHYTVERTIGYLGVVTLTWVIAVIEAFVAYRYLVFRVRGTVLLDLGRFSLLYVGLYFLNLGLLPLFVQVAGLSVLLSQVCIVFPLMVVLSYIGNTRFSFRRPPTPTT